jgi:hypothetical protein
MLARSVDRLAEPLDGGGNTHLVAAAFGLVERQLGVSELVSRRGRRQSARGRQEDPIHCLISRRDRPHVWMFAPVAA